MSRHWKFQSCVHSRLFIKSGRKLLLYFLFLFIWQILCFPSALACGPGRGGGRRRNPRKLTPLVFKQYVPNLSENTIPASGPAEGRISRHDVRFKDLVPNYNPDIVFRDEEGTGADRLMTQRLKEKLNTLAISVMNQWPGVKLRVIEGWEEEGQHFSNSLHYEGRAVDVTTSDRDRSKYGMLARLAVQSGFDWVYYESRHHIHLSVKSEKYDAVRSGGCFLGESLVQSENRGPLRMDQLEVGDRILASDLQGNLHFSPVLLFLDVDETDKRSYVELYTEQSQKESTVERSVVKQQPRLRLTESHLVYVSDRPGSEPQVEFAGKVKAGQYLSVMTHQNQSLDPTIKQELNFNQSQLHLELIVDVRLRQLRGAFAPLTESGNMLVDSTLVSCYAQLANHNLAHLAFLPIRFSWWAGDYFQWFWHWVRSNSSSKSDAHKESTVINDLVTIEPSALVAGKPLAFSENRNQKMNNKYSSTELNSIILDSPNLIASGRQSSLWSLSGLDRRLYNSKLLSWRENETTTDNTNDLTTGSLNPFPVKLARRYHQQGMHWYARLLYLIAQLVIPTDYMYS